ncbi:MAG TPA: hypothetical protein VJW76_11960 [Verrucomicrobiae bacterium]|nr:hypothetical protein [Verrucomicrobiae bacterium]
MRRLPSRIIGLRIFVASLLALATTGGLLPATPLQIQVSEADESVDLLPLTTNRLFALGMIESGNDDRGVGPAGEVSRYQIHPAVWRAYSPSRDYHDPEVSLSVARQHWNYLTNYFRRKAGREPTDFDMYVLWNTRFGYYAGRGFDPGRLHSVVRDRARRFVNLVNR